MENKNNFKKHSYKENKFLIIVPTLNVSIIINDLIDSLIKQSYKNWRLLFIDGGSDNNHYKILTECVQKDKKISIISQSEFEVGIFGAMNQGFSLARNDEWVVFWGSDDFAFNSKVFSSINDDIVRVNDKGIDLLIYGAQYININTHKKGRKSIFLNYCKRLNSQEYTKSLLAGFAPPHQGCVFSPKLIKRRNFYEKGFFLSADLDYFLQISKFHNLNIYNFNRLLVLMGDQGVSGKKTKRRLLEVRKAYRRRFGKIWFLPVLLRYIRRIISLMNI